MPILKIEVPQIGESIEKAIVSHWNKNDGEFVEKDEIICELESEKANLEITSPASGILKIKAQAEQEVKIGEVIGEIEESGEKKMKEKKVDPNQKNSQKNTVVKTSFTQFNNLVSNNSSDLNSVALAHKKRKLSPTESREKMSSFRYSMAKRLVSARQEMVSTTTFNDVDLTNVTRIRLNLKDKFHQKYGVKLGLMSFFVKATINALNELPLFNSQIDQDDIIKNNNINMGIAISRDKGLVVPVLKDVQKMSFSNIEINIIDLSKKANEGKISISELTGGTFTITNGGVYGSLLSTPLLNPPQVSILGMHRIEYRPMASKNDLGDYVVEVRPMMYLALTYDHRLIEGKEAIIFLNCVKQYLQNISEKDVFLD